MNADFGLPEWGSSPPSRACSYVPEVEPKVGKLAPVLAAAPKVGELAPVFAAAPKSAIRRRRSPHGSRSASCRQ
jgi:hypothetical protein